jgi:lysyl-tRNA synthetase class 2
MATLKDYRDERLRKLSELRALNINPFPPSVLGGDKRAKISQLLADFDSLENQSVTAVGRIESIRKFGKIAFIVIRDDSGSIQLFLRDGHLEALNTERGTIGLAELNLLDTGDFVGVTGELIRTKTGEISVDAVALQLLTKALRPMPGRDGFTNKEERFRRRYIDINVNPEVRARYERRSKFWQATRQFLLGRGFIEINIPVLESTTGGADANPFKTHMDAIDEDYYLRISHELPLKRLVGAGYERVFDIGPRFRNEGVDDEHLPEHIAMESYAAYQDYNDGMTLYEDMIKTVCQETWGKLEFERDGLKCDLSQPWPRRTYADLMKEHYDVDVFNPDLAQLKQILADAKVEIGPDANASRLLDNVWKLIRKSSGGPYWMIQEPVSISPLAKKEPSNPLVTQRFHPIILGTEMGNGFSELNDPLDQFERFMEQQKMRDAGDDEAMMLDIDFVEMLEYGMPPTCGWGNSERNFWLFEGVTAREGVPFPAMRHEISETTKSIYNL